MFVRKFCCFSEKMVWLTVLSNNTPAVAQTLRHCRWNKNHPTHLVSDMTIYHYHRQQNHNHYHHHLAGVSGTVSPQTCNSQGGVRSNIQTGNLNLFSCNLGQVSHNKQTKKDTNKHKSKHTNLENVYTLNKHTNIQLGSNLKLLKQTKNKCNDCSIFLRKKIWDIEVWMWIT